MLDSLGVTLDDVRERVARIVGQGDEVTTGQIPFTPRAKKVLELARHEAKALGDNYIRTGHILLGLLRENEGVASRILLDLDADPERIRDEVVRRLSASTGERGAAAGAGPELTLRRVVPLTHRCSDGTWIASVEIWERGIVVRWAGSQDSQRLLPSPALAVSDELGTSYARRGGGAGRSGYGSYGHIQFQPAPPPAAAALHIRGAAADDLVSVPLQD